MPASPAPAHNQLLAALPAEQFEQLHAALEWVPMRLGDLIYEPGVPMQHAYFPTTAIVSLHCVMASGAAVETASVGHEGVVGLSLFLGGDTMTSAAVVQAGGYGFRLGRYAVAHEMARAGGLRQLLLRYTQTQLTQSMQLALCNRHHSVEQQLCRWLLATLDRLPSTECETTQELIARLLGVCRESIADAAGRLQQAGYIRYRRGHISVIDRAGLERNACECYEVVKDEFQRLMPEAGLQRLH